MRYQFCADFETTTEEEDCRVWAWSCINIYNLDHYNWGIDFESFLKYAFSYDGAIYYFRNLKFDGEFILSYLLLNRYEWTCNRNPNGHEFTTLISDKGAFYSMKINNGVNTIELRDSLKIINLSIAQTAKAFNLPIQKGEIDYRKYRPIGYIPDENEQEYIRYDVTIDAMSLIYFFEKGLTKMTQGSDALMDFEEIMGGKKAFRRTFPLLERGIDDYLRKAYKGGYVYVNPANKGQEKGHGYVLDANSLFPSRMKLCKLPYGSPVYYTGKYKKNKILDLYVCHIRCGFTIKPGKLPTIQIKHTLSFQENEYLVSSNGEIVDLFLTSVDYDLFMEHYNTYSLEYIDGYMFKSKIHKEFVEYVDKWGEVKIQASIENNAGLRMVAKLLMNSLYGKFGLSITCRSKRPYLKNGIVHYELLDPEERDGVYLPVALFITAYGRDYTIRHSQKVRDYSLEKYGIDMYLYSDTDSVHTLLSKEDIEKIFDLDDVRLGAWKVESEFSKCLFIRQKCYLETHIKDGKEIVKPTVAGLPKQMHDMVTYENFHIGTQYFRTEDECEGEQGTKKRYKRVKGGVILVDTSFKIKG